MGDKIATRRKFFTLVCCVGVGAATVSFGALGPSDAENIFATKGSYKMLHNAKLLSIKHRDGSESLGAVTDGGVVDIRATSQKLGMPLASTLEELLRSGNADDLTQVVYGAKASGIPLLVEADIVHGRLFTNPSKIICVGLNYRQHATELNMPPPRVPPLFSKYNNALAGHNCVITLPPKDISTKFDYETELLIVIGKTGRNIAEADALDYIAGYCTANDFSSRDLQLELPNSQWMIGKTLDNYAPIGPYFVSSDLVGDPNKLKIETRVNGELRQSSNTSDFIFNTQQMVSYISKYFTLQPGDIIFTGTPQGVILGYPKDKQVWLKAGDKLVSSIEKLGDLCFSLT